MSDIHTYSAGSSALMIVDMQRAYFDAGELQSQQATLSAKCAQLITAFREAERPIIFIRTAHQTSKETWTLNMIDDDQGYLFDGTDDVEILKELDVTHDDIVITKLRDSAFYATTLQQVLASHGVDTIVLAGVSTHSCILMTAADAYARNLRVILAEEAIGSHDSSYHESTLALLTQEYRQPRISNADIMKWIRA